MLGYDFGPQHPLKPERLRRTIELIQRLTGVESIDPGPGDRAMAERVHDPRYVDAVIRVSQGCSDRELEPWGIGTLDTPGFIGMHEASLAYLAGTIRAAEDVRDGVPLAVNIAGGLHHARRAQAHGFCVYNDPAAAVHVLLERFERVAYVDIDVHHGDGVQWIWWDDPRVLTLSIHENPKTLYPGTGFVGEHGPSFTSVNVPIQAKSTGDVWLWAFNESIQAAFSRFEPQAVVLQMGTDAHFQDKLGHLQVSAQEWVEAVAIVKQFELPIVAVGGGGYNLTTVPRMWTAAILTLAGIPFEDAIPEDLAAAWDMPRFFDRELPGPIGSGRAFAEQTVTELRERVLPFIPTP